MRLKRLMSIVLAALLIMSFAMSVSAGELYLEIDYAKYAENFNTIANDVFEDRNMKDHEGGAGNVAYDVPTWRANKNIIHSNKGNGTCQAAYAGVTVNSLGHYEYEQTYSFGQTFVGYVPSKSWDAVNNTNETYVISADINPIAYGYNYYFMSAIGNRGTSDAPAYNRASLMTMPASGKDKFLFCGTSISGGTDAGFTKGGDTKRVAFGFNYVAGEDRLARVAAVNSEVKTTSDVNVGLDGMKSIDAVMFYMQRNTTPKHGLIRMYTIDTAAGFNVTADIDGENRLDVNTSSAAITFTHPVADVTADSVVYTLKEGTTTIGTLDATDIVTGTVDGKYVSTATVTLPTLEENADYEIVVSGVKNELGSELADNTISFSTPKPDITMTTPTITGAAVGSMSVGSVAISNNTDSTPKAVSVIYAVYTTAGQLVDVVYANDTIAAGKTATISAGITLGTDVAKAKVMVWDGASLVSPLRGFYKVELGSAAQ